jgi:RimJ/RimL family protein N-acetyltransferase
MGTGDRTMSRIAGARVTLRPVTEADLPLVARASMEWAKEGESEAHVLERLKARVRGETPFRAIELAIEADGRLVGDVQGRRDQYLSGLFEIGISLFDEADRGRGFGREALSLMTAHLFDQEEAYRVQLSTDVTNTAMRHAAEAAGFTFEGVLRGFWPPTGDQAAADYAMYAITKSDYEGMT